MLEFGSGVAVKVCGLKNARDAIDCAAAGVEVLGLNFSPKSLRCISPAVAAAIIAAVRARFAQTKFVGVFLDQERDLVQTITADLALDAVQLHGDEPAEFVDNLNAPFVIKALRVGPSYSATMAQAYHCDAILLDSWSATSSGGTGMTFPWSVAATLRPRVKRLILAGGLTPENVADAVRGVRPFAVDVCSGVEDAAREKNPEKVRRFVQAVKAAEEAIA